MRAPVEIDREPSHFYYGKPVWRCGYCGHRFERVDDLRAVQRHEQEEHAPAQPEPRVSSSILGPDGRPAETVTEE